MQPEPALTTISHTEIAIFLLTLLLVLLISVRKELSGDAPVRGCFNSVWPSLVYARSLLSWPGIFKRGK
jgi:hypothetical protein